MKDLETLFISFSHHPHSTPVRSSHVFGISNSTHDTYVNVAAGAHWAWCSETVSGLGTQPEPSFQRPIIYDREHVNQQFNKLTAESVCEQDLETAVNVGILELTTAGLE